MHHSGPTAGPSIPACQDLTYDNFVCSVLSAGTAITDVIDITPALAGGRAFASATLPLCHHDYKQIRDLMRGQLVDLAGSWTACANLGCVVL